MPWLYRECFEATELENNRYKLHSRKVPVCQSKPAKFHSVNQMCSKYYPNFNGNIQNCPTKLGFVQQTAVLQLKKISRRLKLFYYSVANIKITPHDRLVVLFCGRPHFDLNVTHTTGNGLRGLTIYPSSSSPVSLYTY